MRLFHNTAAVSVLHEDAPSPLAYHQRLPDYAPTPLRDLPAVAAALGIGKLYLKDESQRLGMPSFKILGASWAIYQALEQRAGGLRPWQHFDELVAQVAALRPLTLAAATDGNHGRAVARMARLFGFSARIFVPAGTAQARIDAIQSEGAEAIVVEGTYDEAVARSAEEAGPRCLVISDTSWPGYEDVPRWVIDGYATILLEAEQQMAALGESTPDLVVVQIGVGALAAAVVRHFRRPGLATRPLILGVEPTGAPCVLASLEAGQLTEVPGPHESIMAGLNCGLPSLIAWPVVSAGIDAVVAVDDQLACQAVRDLAAHGVVAGETGAAGLGGLNALLMGAAAAEGRALLKAHSTTRALVISTEGATDPYSRARVLAADCARDCQVVQACKRG
jgi:diaminopropionate ammonia-lyase